MGDFVNPDNGAFEKAVSSKIYVDKTELLEYTNGVLDTLQGYICNSRPQHFGKSITADMLVAYYSKGCDSKEMFSGLKISQTTDFRKHLNQHDVIHLDIQRGIESAGGPEDIVPYISQTVIFELQQYYPGVLDSSIKSLPEALLQINVATGSRFIVIVDEWDALIRDEVSDLKVQERYMNFLRGLFKGTEPMRYIQLAYLTGILPIKREETQSGLNNFREFTMISPKEFAKYIGFTEEEVQNLCTRYDCDFEGVKRWCDGYLLGNYQVYNPKAVIEVLLCKQFRSYRPEMASYEPLVPLINMDYHGLKTALIEMLSGGSSKVNTITFQNDTTNIRNKDDVLTYLIHLGYLGYDQTRKEAFVPNEEIRQELMAAVEDCSWNEMKNCRSTVSENLAISLDEAQKWVSSVGYTEDNVNDIIKSVRQGKRKQE